MGRPLLVEDIDEPFNQTMSRLAQQLYVKQGEWRVNVGDRQVTVADGFRLYWTTRLACPSLMQEIPASVNVVDFTFIDDAITDQLISCICQYDKPVSSMCLS